MLLDALQNFEWYNDPQDVALSDEGMYVKSSIKTDFWQSYKRDYHKDNGHFFFKKTSGDFTIIVKWGVSNLSALGQCGLMLRLDEFNWFKMSGMQDAIGKDFIATSVTNFGTSDFAKHIHTDIKNEIIYYKLQAKDNEYSTFYSHDGNNYHHLRTFEFFNETKEMQVGAYICSPADKNISAMLYSIEFE